MSKSSSVFAALLSPQGKYLFDFFVIKNDKGYIDRFRGRVVFPIKSMAGRILGFGGRTLISETKVAKYT